MHEAVDWEVAAKPAAESLMRLAAAMPEGVLLLREGCVLWASERLVEMAGWGAPRALDGTPLGELFGDTGEGLPDERLRPVECALQRANGQQCTVVCRPAWPAVAPGADAWVVEDATRTRELERELHRMSRDLHRANRELAALREKLRQERSEREELLTVVSHELRTPLTVIGGYARLLLGEEVGPLTPRQRGFLDETQKGCRKLDAFVERLIGAARAPGGGEVLEVATAPLRPLVEEVAGGLAPLLEQAGVRVSLEGLPAALAARFDRARVEQVLRNLLDNAVSHARATVLLEARERGDGERRLVEVSVADDGPGVPVEERQRIFEPYVRGGTAHSARGLGLGLALCRRLVEAHGGTIGVDERPGGGARFAFTLPAGGA
jgi:signal transduction histidine kinase